MGTTQNTMPRSAVNMSAMEELNQSNSKPSYAHNLLQSEKLNPQV
jgi:hypothetical protein